MLVFQLTRDFPPPSERPVSPGRLLAGVVLIPNNGGCCAAERSGRGVLWGVPPPPAAPRGRKAATASGLTEGDEEEGSGGVEPNSS